MTKKAGYRTKRRSSDRTRPDAREKLLTAAIEIIGRKGFGAASVKTIAKRAGVNHGLVHYHFGGKDQLILEAVRRDSERNMEAVRALRSSALPAEYWKAIWDAARAQMRNSLDAYRLGAQITAESVLPSSAIGKPLDALLSAWNAEVAGVLTAGKGRKPTARDLLITRLIHGATLALAYWALRDPKADVEGGLRLLEDLTKTAME